MSEPFIGEIRIFSFNFPPRGWATCDGQTLPIAQNQALFSLLGTTYGGNGVQTFALPGLRGRAPLGMGQGAGLSSYVEGQVGGEENHTLILSEMPAHVHPVPATGNAATAGTGPSGAMPAAANASKPWRTGGGSAVAIGGAVASNTGSQAHSNMQPYLVLNFCIAVTGIFPSRN